MKIIREFKRFVAELIFDENGHLTRKEIEKDTQMAALRARKLEDFRYLHWR